MGKNKADKVRQQRNERIIKQLDEILNDDSFQSFENASLNLPGWMYYEPVTISFDDRLELDREAYKKAFCNLKSLHRSDYIFNESEFLRGLSDIITALPMDPYFRGYNNFIQERINEDNHIGDPKYDKRIFMSPGAYTTFLKCLEEIPNMGYRPLSHVFFFLSSKKLINVVDHEEFITYLEKNWKALWFDNNRQFKKVNPNPFQDQFEKVLVS